MKTTPGPHPPHKLRPCHGEQRGSVMPAVHWRRRHPGVGLGGHKATPREVPLKWSWCGSNRLSIVEKAGVTETSPSLEL